jgi:hypothetical protein
MITSKAFAEKYQNLTELNLGSREVSPSREPIFSVDLNSRKIEVPSAFRTLAVKGDTSCETIWFILERYFDGVDLQDKPWGVQFTNAKKEVGFLNAYPLILDDIPDKSLQNLIPFFDKWSNTQNSGDNGQTLILYWEIPYELTKDPGTVSLSLRCLETKEGKISYSLSTEPISLQIKDTNLVSDFSENILPPADTLTTVAQQIFEVWNGYDQLKPVSYSKLSEKPKILIMGETEDKNVEKDLEKITIDYELDENSTNSVQNKTIYNEINTIYDEINSATTATLELAKAYTNEKLDNFEIAVDLELNETSAKPVQNKAIYSAIKTAIETANKNTEDKLNSFKITVDSELSEASENPVQNKIICSNINTISSEIEKIKNELAELTYIPLSILKFENNINLAEVGSTVNTIIFNWELNNIPRSLKIDETDIPVLQTGNYTFENANIKENKTFTLTATDKGNESQLKKETNIVFSNRVYYGVAENPQEYDSNFIKLFGDGVLQTSYQNEFTVTAGKNQYIYYIIPTSYNLTDTSSFSYGGFSGGFEKVATINYTNNYNTTSYDVWKSDNPNLGSTTIKVV